MSAAAPGQQDTELVLALDAVLPQTQCTRCGYPDCRGYARAIASGDAEINRCPPGGAEGIRRLSAVSGRAVIPLEVERGSEGPRALAVIDESWCIGCTLCIKACPVDCIVGASKLMHTVIDALCTGCELCVPACPVDCITMDPDAPAWSEDDIALARVRHRDRAKRLVRERHDDQVRLAGLAVAKLAALTEEPDDPATARKRAVVEAAIRRARERLAGSQT